MTHEEKKERKKAWQKKYYETHKQEILDRRKEYNKAYLKEYRQKNVEECKKRDREYYEKNKSSIAAYHSSYYEANKDIEEVAAQKKSNGYRTKDSLKGFDTSNNIGKEWIIENIFKGKCVYCGAEEGTKMVADRIDNSRPHTPDNCVCSCCSCNTKRGDRYAPMEFQAKMFAEKFGC